ncbi:MAG: hypothetical protein ACKPEA_06055 [Planctomycetota bacterium]
MIGAIAVATILSFVGCERSPSAPSVNQGLPQSPDGRRTSVPGKAMDRAEDLKKEVDAYNQAIEDTIAQGTNETAPKRKGAKEAPPAMPPETP